MVRIGILGLLFAATFCVQAEQSKPLYPFGETAAEIASNIRLGETSSEEVTRSLLARIVDLDRTGPRIQSIISLNPDAISAAIELDHEAQSGKFRSPLHGVPVLLKDNIESRELPTTAGSLALENNETKRDAPIVNKLREAGMVILGKSNLSEWANYRSSNSISGWSGIGSLTRNPYDLRRTACGSSSGSAAAVAASFVPVALGTETNGSITCPASVMGLVGFKPTIGLLSRRHIIPLSPRQDSAGPITHTVEDAALLLNLMAGTDPEDAATREADNRVEGYVKTLDDGIQDMRIGVFRWAEGKSEPVSKAFNQALEKFKEAGATLVEIDKFSPAPILWREGDRILQTEFKADLNEYLKNSPADIEVRSVEDLIEFNSDNADRELALFDQSILIKTAAAGDVDDPEFKQTVADYVQAARASGVDLLLSEHDVRLLVMPSTKPTAPIDLFGTSIPAGGLLGASWLGAAAGYPALTVPMGHHEGLPLGLMIVGTAWDDAAVLRAGYAFERLGNPIPDPSFADGDLEQEEIINLIKPFQ